MSKLTAMFTIALLLSFVLTYAARPNPLGTQEAAVGEENTVEVDEICEGAGKEECLMRTTLAAHVDYIYTQRHKDNHHA